MRLPIFQVDAFTDTLFTGNPAAVVPLESWLPDERLLAIAAENNLSETAFLVPADGDYALRWFTPALEIDLCGHATLAAAHVIATALEPGRERIDFRTRKAGRLIVERTGDLYTLDFPSRPASRADAPAGLVAALGGPAPVEVLAARDHLIVYPDAETVLALAPDMARLAAVECFAACVTAPGRDGVDFVSRFFGPKAGVAEDPVTGSAHCTLIPYWAGRLGKTRMTARQVSARGGSLACELKGDRVRIGGQAVLYLEGTIRA